MARPKEENHATRYESAEHKLLKMSEISLWLDTYEDIFSDFDPREFSQRSLSVDFLEEAERASRDKGVALELKLLVPKKRRKVSDEGTIKKRLRTHFKRHYEMIRNDIKKTIRQGVFYVIAGIIIMLFASLMVYFQAHTFLATFLIVLLEPAGWFLFWEGLNQVIFESNKAKPQLEFYKKMSKCQITFLPY
ncbi:hypothetical protein HY486_02070 [Candidatus Woesearchaeota archaeon]|nr:hypothetical protein [Candidatus Woesearchaeota archaeon]